MERWRIWFLIEFGVRSSFPDSGSSTGNFTYHCFCTIQVSAQWQWQVRCHVNMKIVLTSETLGVSPTPWEPLSVSDSYCFYMRHQLWSQTNPGLKLGQENTQSLSFLACTTRDITTYLPVFSWGLSWPNAYTMVKHSAWPRVNTQIITIKEYRERGNITVGR